ncbi:MAG: YbgC/FadM family acyl-CoA thioesterase [Fibrobacterota bacterium]
MQIRVYYEDTDCGSVVYYANYLKYMERSRTEYLRDRGVDLAEFHQQGLMFAVIEAHVKYRRPARYNDLLEVESTITDKTSVSMTFETKIFNQKGDHLVTGTVTLACISTEGKARRLPEEVKNVAD